MALQALIFDVDGTLAETEELHRQAFNESFAAFEVSRDWIDVERQWNWDQEIYAQLLKTTGGKERIAAYLREYLGMNPEPHRLRIAELHKAKTDRYVALLEHGVLELRPGIRELIESAREGGLRLAVATTTSLPNVVALSRACFEHEPNAIFNVVAAGDEVSKKKPAPDVYELALSRLGIAAEDCIALEDSNNGVKAAKSAGIKCVVCPGIYTRNETHDEADLIVSSFGQVSIRRMSRIVAPGADREAECRTAVSGNS